MKKINNIFLIIFCLIVSVIVKSCDDMNDIQSQFADREEQIYLGKVDSIKFFPGNERVKITWYVGSDPKIDKTIIYWNMRNDSIIKDFVRTTSGVQKDSIIIDNLPEGSTLFEFRNVSNAGETSLLSMAAATVWGPKYGDGLYSRRIVSHNYNYEDSKFELGLSSVFEGDSVVYSEVIYQNINGENKSFRIERNIKSVVLQDFPDGGEFRFRTAFFPPQGIDTIFNNFQSFNAPKAIFEKGQLISLKGSIDSRYFNRDGNLYEWNSDGDLLVYTFDEENSLVLSEHYPNLLSRAVYRDFFFHDDDKFISIGVDNRVYMQRFSNGSINIVKTPTGSDFMSSGYVMQTFIPAKAFFYSIYDNKDLRTFFPNNNATWGEGNLTRVASGFNYSPVTVFDSKFLIAVDGDGSLVSIPITTIGQLGNKSTIGKGWDKFKKIVGIKDKLLCLDENGDFYQFDFNATDFYWIIEE